VLRSTDQFAEPGGDRTQAASAWKLDNHWPGQPGGMAWLVYKSRVDCNYINDLDAIYQDSNLESSLLLRCCPPDPHLPPSRTPGEHPLAVIGACAQKPAGSAPADQEISFWG
jgi:hypothetical protein